MQNKSTLLLLALSVAVFGVITTEIAIIGLLPKGATLEEYSANTATVEY